MVEWKKLGEVCEILDSQRKPVSKGKRVQGIFPYYGANGIQDYVDKYIFDGTFLLLGEDGSVKNEDNTPVLHWATGKIWVNNHAHILKECDGYILRYIYYSLQCVDVSDIVRGVPPKISQANMRNILIPIPSLEEQERIVGILDTFNASIDNIKAQIEQRRKQYEHYRNTLLTFNKDDDSVEWKTLEDIFELRNGYTPSKANSEFWTDGTIPWFRMEDIRDKGRILLDSYLHITESAIKGKGLFKANSFILATTATIGEHALLIADSLANQRFTNLKIRKSLINNIDIKFMFYYMFVVDEFCKSHTNVSGFASVDMNALKRMAIPIPSLARQQEIVSILDTFEASITNLEAQLEQRQKQYEYYREELLTF